MTAFALWITSHWLAIAAVGVLGGVVALWGLMAPSLIRERRNAAAFDVHRYLITAPADLKMDTWAATAMFTNWIVGRENGDRETWLTTVFNAHSQEFLEVARTIGVTVEEIHGAGDSETYELLVGEPGTGWQGREIEVNDE